ncbi:MAG: ABC transporter permease, partial [Planctomycetota bacterium]|nr:ABC transporter permease [Planctomycetota bacterium]
FLLRPLPFEQPDQLVHVWRTHQLRESETDRLSMLDFKDFKDQSTTLDDLGAYYYGSDIITGAGDPLRVQVTSVTSNLLGLLGVQPQAGRTFNEDDSVSGNDKVILLNHRFWVRHKQSDPNVCGSAITLDGVEHTIVGIMPETFEFPLKATMLWKPLPMDGADQVREASGPLLVVGRLKNGVTIDEAQTELALIGKRLEEAHPEVLAGMGVNIVPLREAMVFFYDLLKLMFLAMLIATGFVTLIVCANVGNLLLARGMGKSHELAIRAALGAGRWRIVRHLFTESLCLALLGGGAGVILAYWGVKFIGPAIPEDLYRAGSISVDGPVLLFTLGASLLVAILFGLVPALASSRIDLNQTLRAGGRSNSGNRRTQRMHSTLVVSEIALAMVLVVGSVLMVRSFVKMQDVKPGFNPDQMLTAEMILPRKEYETRESWNNFYDDALRRLEALPQVTSAAAVYPLPMNFESFDQSFIPEDRPFSSREDAKSSAVFWVTPGFFRTMEIPVQYGRPFNEFDDSDSEPVVVVNEFLAQRYWPDENPVGRRLRLNPGEDDEKLVTVIGVAGDIKHFLMTDKPTAQIFKPQSQVARNRRFLLLRTDGDPLQQVQAMRGEIASIDPGLPITEIRSMREVVDQSLAMWGGAASTFGGLGIGALILAAIGLYSLIAYSIGQRLNELGIRIALGAKRNDILMLVMRRGLWLAGLGVTIGTVGAFFLSQLLGMMLFEINAGDPVTFVMTASILIVTALVACFLPALKATRVDPMVALRNE